MPKVTLIGCGAGVPGELSTRAMSALNEAALIVGSKRLVESFGREGTRCLVAVKPAEIMAVIGELGECKRACVLMSGDTGFYSGARQLMPLLEEAAAEVEVVCGVSSVQLLAAALHEPWQDWELVSAHGVDVDVVGKLMGGKPVFFLTGSAATPASLCTQLVEAGLGGVEVVVGERLGYPEQRIVRATAAVVAQRSFETLSVMLVRAIEAPLRRAPGFPDECFVRDAKVPMTKQVVRAAIAAKLGVGPSEVCWDVGAGTGSVSVELALQAREVWAVERNSQALALIEENRCAFGAYNLHVVEGEAPEALVELPAPDAVFIGGSGGNMRAIVDAAFASNPHVRICASAIALETIHAVMEALAAHGVEAEVTQVSAASTRKAGELHLLLAQNPTFLICSAAG